MLLPGQGQENLRLSLRINEISFGYIYVAHPRSVTAVSWRKTSKYMPKGAVANVLATSCTDNICRLWCETVRLSNILRFLLIDSAIAAQMCFLQVLPDDGIVSMRHLDPTAAQDTKFRTHRQKAKFVQRFRHVRQSFAARKLAKSVSFSSSAASPAHGQSRPAAASADPIASLPSTYSIHEFHNYSFQSTGISPGLHFHLAASINALSDIPLVPAMNRPTTGLVTYSFFCLRFLNPIYLNAGLFPLNFQKSFLSRHVALQGRQPRPIRCCRNFRDIRPSPQGVLRNAQMSQNSPRTVKNQ